MESTNRSNLYARNANNIASIVQYHVQYHTHSIRVLWRDQTTVASYIEDVPMSRTDTLPHPP